MEILRRQIARAHRRLVLQSLAGHLAWCWTVTLTLAVIAIGIGAIWPPLADYRLWAITCLATALGTGALAAAVWTWAGRQTALDAAAEIDHRFALKERVSSTLALAPDQLQSDAGRALVQDAASRIERIDVAEQFGVRPGRRALMPFVPAAVALALVAIIGQRVPQLPVQAATTDNAQIKKSTQALAKKLETQRRQAAAHDLPEADAILKQLEAQTKNMAEKTPADRTRALVALNDVVKEAEKRRQQLTGPAELKQQLSQLKNLQPGPADKLANAMKKANFEQAKQELDKLQDQLSGDKLTEPEKKQLGQQLDQMRQALEKMTEAHRQAEDELRKQVEAQRKSGNVAEADKLQQQLDKLAEKGPQMQKLGQMAQQLQKASESMKNGDCKQASAALGKLSNELAGMQKEPEELETPAAAARRGVGLQKPRWLARNAMERAVKPAKGPAISSAIIGAGPRGARGAALAPVSETKPRTIPASTTPKSSRMCTREPRSSRGWPTGPTARGRSSRKSREIFPTPSSKPPKPSATSVCRTITASTRRSISTPCEKVSARRRSTRDRTGRLVAAVRTMV